MPGTTGAVGYAPCADGSPEAGVEMVAIYVRGGEPAHAARLLPSGHWTSKLGAQEDIEHTLDGLEGTTYGSPVVFLRRPIITRP